MSDVCCSLYIACFAVTRLLFVVCVCVACCLMLIDSVFSTVCRLVFVVRCSLLFVVCCLLVVACCLLLAGCCFRFAVCCLLFAVCCSLFVVG